MSHLKRMEKRWPQDSDRGDGKRRTVGKDLRLWLLTIVSFETLLSFHVFHHLFHHLRLFPLPRPSFSLCENVIIAVRSA